MNIQLEYPTIASVPEGISRPFWSVMIPTYNRASYLERSLKSILEQDPGYDNMHIEVVDNCSTQDSESVVRKIGGDRVIFYRQPNHVDASTNFTTCIRRAHGHWVHIMHDDDMLLHGFYDTYHDFIEAHPQVGMVFSRTISIDENDEWLNIMYNPPDQRFSGIVEDVLYKLLINNFVVCPSVTVSRQIYETVGGFNPALSFSLDWEMWIRIASISPIGYIHRPLMLYRLHPESPGSGTKEMFVHGFPIEEAMRNIEFGVNMLTYELQESARKGAYRNLSYYAIAIRNIMHTNRQYKVALRYAFHALKLHHSFRNLLRMIKSAFRAYTNPR